MRIISKFKDYYDTAAAYGVDETLTYVRITTKLEGESPSQQGLFRDIKNNRRYYYECGKVGFCGKIYPFLTVGGELSNDPPKTVWSFEELDEYASSIEPDWKESNPNYGKRFKNMSWYAAYNHFLGGVKEKMEPFHKYNTPIFLKMDFNYLVIDPNLSKLEFYRVVDAYQAHQQISMFLGGLLNRPENEMVEISNENKVRKHGFDEHSFRAMKGEGPRRKRKKNRG